MKITHDNTLTNKQKDMGIINEQCDIRKVNRDITEQVEELKRLQLEIDKAEANKKWLMQESFGREFDRSEDIEFQCSDLQVHTNTSRIREIILNEL